MTAAPALDLSANHAADTRGPAASAMDAGQYFHSGAVRWHFFRSGQGPRLLLLHGTGSAAESWRRLAALLAGHFEILAPDLPGHGYSGALAAGASGLDEFAAALRRLIDDLDAAPRIIVGHSAGAAIAARMAADDERIAVLGLNAALRPLAGWSAATFVPLARLLGTNRVVARLVARLVAADPGAVRRLLDSTGSRIDAGMTGLYEDLLHRPEHVAGTLRMLASWDLRALMPHLRGLGARLTLVAGGADRIIAPQDALWVHEQVPGSRLLRLPAVGHLAHEEAPGAVARIVMSLAQDLGLLGQERLEGEAGP